MCCARAASWQTLRFDERRWHDDADLQALLAPHLGDLACTRLTREEHLRPEALWQWCLGMYDLHLLPPESLPGLRAEFLRRCQPLTDAEGIGTAPPSPAGLLGPATLSRRPFSRCA